MEKQNTDSETLTHTVARGMWHRPNVTNEETTLEGICSVLDKIKYSGINLVFLEVFYHGMTMFKTDTVEYYRGFEAFDYSPYPDYLTAFLAEAKKRNIEIHAWVEDFNIGVENSKFVNNYQHWLMKTDKGGYRQSEGAEHGGYIFLDPANAEVRKFLVDFYKEILRKFPDIKGLNLDYIRYPISTRQSDTGFTETAMAQFAAQQGWELEDGEIDTFIRKLGSTNSHSSFTDFRAGSVTEFVEQVFEMIRTEYPHILLSTAIFPETSESYSKKKQDIMTWLERGYLDIVTPMAYYDGNLTLKRVLKKMTAACGKCYCYAGLSSTFHSLSHARVERQIKISEDVGADGFSFFGSQSILENGGYMELLHGRFGSTMPSDRLPHRDIPDTVRRISSLLTEELMQKAKIGEERLGKITELGAKTAELASLGEMSIEQAEAAAERLMLLIRRIRSYVSCKNIKAARQKMKLLHRYISLYTSRARARQAGRADISNEGGVH